MAGVGKGATREVLRRVLQNTARLFLFVHIDDRAPAPLVI